MSALFEQRKHYGGSHGNQARLGRIFRWQVLDAQRRGRCGRHCGLDADPTNARGRCRERHQGHEGHHAAGGGRHRLTRGAFHLQHAQSGDGPGRQGHRESRHQQRGRSARAGAAELELLRGQQRRPGQLQCRSAACQPARPESVLRHAHVDAGRYRAGGAHGNGRRRGRHADPLDAGRAHRGGDRRRLGGVRLRRGGRRGQHHPRQEAQRAQGAARLRQDFAG